LILGGGEVDFFTLLIFWREWGLLVPLGNSLKKGIKIWYGWSALFCAGRIGRKDLKEDEEMRK
jgi:peptidase E